MENGRYGQKKLDNIPGVPTSFRQELAKKIAKCYEKRKTRESVFTYILAIQCRSYFNLTNSNFAHI